MSFWDDPLGWVSDRAEDLYHGAVDLFEDIGGGIADFFDKALSTIGNVVTNVLNDPLPTIATIALTSVGVPPQVTAAVRTAMQGGDLEDMLISVGTSYVGGQISGLVGEGISGLLEDPTAGLDLGDLYFDAKQDVIKELITGASGPAFMAAAKGASFDKILEATITGAVSSKVGIGIREELGIDPSQIDGRIYDSAIKAATSALLRGQDIATAVGGAIANTGLSAAIGGATNGLKNTISSIENQTAEIKELEDQAYNQLSEYRLYDRWANSALYRANQYKQEVLNARDGLNSDIIIFNDYKAAYEAGDQSAYEQALAAKNRIDFSESLYKARKQNFDTEVSYANELREKANQSANGVNGLYNLINQKTTSLNDLFEDRNDQVASLNNLVDEFLSSSINVGQDLAKDIAGDAINLIDDQTVSADEARQAFESAGYTPTESELNKFLTGYTESEAQQQIKDYATERKSSIEQSISELKQAEAARRAEYEKQYQESLLEQQRIREANARLLEEEAAQETPPEPTSVAPETVDEGDTFDFAAFHAENQRKYEEAKREAQRIMEENAKLLQPPPITFTPDVTETPEPVDIGEPPIPPITFTPDVTETPEPVDIGEPVIKREEVYPDFFSPPAEPPEPPAAPDVPVAERVDIQPAEDTGAPDLTFTPGERQYETMDDLLSAILSPDYQAVNAYDIPPDFVETMPDEVYQEPIGTPQDIWPEDIPQEPEFVETMPDEVYQEPQIPESLDLGWPTIPGGGAGGIPSGGTPISPPSGAGQQPSGTGQQPSPTAPVIPSVAAPQGVDLLTFLAALGMLGAPQQQQQQQPQYKVAELPDYVPFEQILTPYADTEDLTQRGRYG